MRTELALLHKRLERTMVYVTHDQIEAMTMADRIVIMDQGVVQQIGTPREVYTAPRNLFVAGFIGSPSMNFLDAELDGEGDALTVRGDGFSLPVSERLRARALAAPERQVTVGLRPEHFLAERTSDARHHAVALDVDVAEYIGSSQFLAAHIGAKPVTATVFAGPDADPMRSGEYFFDVSRMYLFDRATGEAL